MVAVWGPLEDTPGYAAMADLLSGQVPVIVRLLSDGTGGTTVRFGDGYRVLRGASWATSPLVARTTFRNWDFPVRRQIFAGLRCARDA